MDGQRQANEGIHSWGMDAACESENPWLLASQIREMLGDDGDLDPAFFEESWVSGVPVQFDSFRSGRDRKTKAPVEGVTFAELSGLGGFLPSPATLPQDYPSSGHSDRPANLYTAAWLRQPLNGSASHVDGQASTSNLTDEWNVAPAKTECGDMTYHRAREILCLSDDSSVPQIKTAYRRMVSKWHPDRLEQSGESLRALATKRMAAINEAYHYLQNYQCAAKNC